MSKVSFIHRRRISNGIIQNNGGQTIAFRELNNGKIEYASALCNPKDNFSRAMGRVKAEGRLNSTRYRDTVNLSYDDFIKINSKPIYVE